MSHTTAVVDQEEVPQQSVLGLVGDSTGGRQVHRRVGATLLVLSTLLHRLVVHRA